MKKIIAMPGILFLCSCTFMIPTKQYDGGNKSPADIAIIKSYVGNPFVDEFHATISGFKKVEATGEVKHKSLKMPLSTDHPKEIHVLSGDYIVELYCFKSLLHAYHPTVSLSVKAGNTYLLKCDADGKEPRAYLFEETKTASAKSK